MKPTPAEKTAVKQFTEESRIKQFFEETGELMAVLARSSRTDRAVTPYDIKLELIHVQQSINMLNLIYFDNEQQYNDMYDFEDRRLQKVIDNDKMHRGMLNNMEVPTEADISLVEYREQVLGECSH